MINPVVLASLCWSVRQHRSRHSRRQESPGTVSCRTLARPPLPRVRAAREGPAGQEAPRVGAHQEPSQVLRAPLRGPPGASCQPQGAHGTPLLHATQQVRTLTCWPPGDF